MTRDYTEPAEVNDDDLRTIATLSNLKDIRMYHIQNILAGSDYLDLVKNMGPKSSIWHTLQEMLQVQQQTNELLMEMLKELRRERRIIRRVTRSSRPDHE